MQYREVGPHNEMGEGKIDHDLSCPVNRKYRVAYTAYMQVQDVIDTNSRKLDTKKRRDANPVGYFYPLNYRLLLR